MKGNQKQSLMLATLASTMMSMNQQLKPEPGSYVPPPEPGEKLKIQKRRNKNKAAKKARARNRKMK